MCERTSNHWACCDLNEYFLQQIQRMGPRNGIVAINEQVHQAEQGDQGEQQLHGSRSSSWLTSTASMPQTSQPNECVLQKGRHFQATLWKLQEIDTSKQVGAIPTPQTLLASSRLRPDLPSPIDGKRPPLAHDGLKDTNLASGTFQRRPCCAVQLCFLLSSHEKPARFVASMVSDRFASPLGHRLNTRNVACCLVYHCQGPAEYFLGFTHSLTRSHKYLQQYLLLDLPIHPIARG